MGVFGWIFLKFSAEKGELDNGRREGVEEREEKHPCIAMDEKPS